MKLVHQIAYDCLHDADRRSQAGKKHHDKKDGGKHHAEIHLCEDRGQGDENKRRPHACFNIEGCGSRENNQPKQNRHNGVAEDNHERAAADCLFAVEIGAVNNQISASNAERKERLPNGGHNRLAVETGEIRQKIELNALSRSRQHNCADCEKDDKQKHQRQQDIADLFNAALDAAQDNHCRNQQHDGQPEQHLPGICRKVAEQCDHLIRRHAAVCAGNGFEQVGHRPAGDTAVKRQGKRQSNYAQDTD